MVNTDNSGASGTRTIVDLSDHEQRFGVRFNDVGLLQQALTHRSYLNEHPEWSLKDNERLEFLGDAIIDFLAAEYLFTRFPDMDEGTLTRLRAGIVRNESLAVLATRIGIGERLVLGKGEEESGGRTRASNLGSAFEAFSGALYLDQGMTAVLAFVLPLFTAALEEMLHTRSDKDAKSRLQEWCQGRLNITPVYRTTSVTGPDHAREFTIEVVIGEQVYGVGMGRSKQIAAQAAATNAWNNLLAAGQIDEQVKTR